MANPNVGMIYPVFAPIESHTDGSMPTYGTGFVIQEARNATVTRTYSNNPLYGDDRIVDDDNGLTDLTISFESTGLTDSDRINLLGEEAWGTTAQWVTDAETPWGGFGYIRKMRLNGEKSYEAWIDIGLVYTGKNRIRFPCSLDFFLQIHRDRNRAVRRSIYGQQGANFCISAVFDVFSISIDILVARKDVADFHRFILLVIFFCFAGTVSDFLTTLFGLFGCLAQLFLLGIQRTNFALQCSEISTFGIHLNLDFSHACFNLFESHIKYLPFP